MGRTFLFDIRFRCCLFTHAIVFTVTYRYNGFASTDDARFFGVKSGHRCARFLFSLVDLVIELAVSYIFFKPVAKLSMLRPLNCIRHRIKHKYIFNVPHTPASNASSHSRILRRQELANFVPKSKRGEMLSKGFDISKRSVSVSLNMYSPK